MGDQLFVDAAGRSGDAVLRVDQVSFGRLVGREIVAAKQHSLRSFNFKF